MPWGFRGKEDHLKEDKMSRCSVITCLPYPIGHKKLFMVITVIKDKAPNLDSLRKR